MIPAAAIEQVPSPFAPEVRQQLITWLSQPQGVNVEMLGGELRPKAMAKLKHGRAQLAIGSQFFHLDGPSSGGPGGEPPSGGTRWWLAQEVDVYIGGQGMRPDVAGWRIDRNPNPPQETNVDRHLGVITTPPDWVCEVLSVSTAVRDQGSARDRGIKWKAYQRAGVEWYWLVDLLSGSLTVYQRTERSYEVIDVAGPGDVVRLPPFSEVDFVLAKIFSG